MARPTKLNAGTADLIVTLIEGGVPRDHAARAAGIDPSTLFAWMRRGEQEDIGNIDPADYTIGELRALAAHRDIDTHRLRTKAAIAEAISRNPSPFTEFHHRIRAADSRFMAAGIGKMRETGADDWRMWDRLLERRFPELRIQTPPEEELGPEDALTEDEAQAQLERAKEIRIKMLGSGA
jgi:hypothetical protein